MQSVLGFKSEQTQKFLMDGTRIPVTVISVPDTVVSQVKTQEKESYTAIQLAIGKKKKPTKALIGHMKKAHSASSGQANIENAPLFLREVRLAQDASNTLPSPGEFLKASEVLESGDIVKVTGTSKGKGFAGGVKRHGFKGGPRTHGQSDRERAPGSIGQTTTPGRVYKGKRMAGRMGTERVTVQNLVVVAVDDVAKTLLVKGLIPGNIGNLVIVEKTGKVKEKSFVPLHAEETDSAPADTKEPEEQKSEEIKADEAPQEQAEQAPVAEKKTEEPENAVDAASEAEANEATAVKTEAAEESQAEAQKDVNEDTKEDAHADK